MSVFPGSLQRDFFNVHRLNVFYNIFLIDSLWCLTSPPPIQLVVQHVCVFYALATYKLSLALYQETFAALSLIACEDYYQTSPTAALNDV